MGGQYQTWVQIHCIVFKYNYKYYKIFKYKYNCNYFGQDSNEIQMQILSIVFKYNLNTLILSHMLRSFAYVNN